MNMAELLPLKVYWLHFTEGLHLVDKHVVVVVALLFYVHCKHLRSCRDGQLT